MPFPNPTQPSPSSRFFLPFYHRLCVRRPLCGADGCVSYKCKTVIIVIELVVLDDLVGGVRRVMLDDLVGFLIELISVLVLVCFVFVFDCRDEKL